MACIWSTDLLQVHDPVPGGKRNTSNSKISHARQWNALTPTSHSHVQTYHAAGVLAYKIKTPDHTLSKHLIYICGAIIKDERLIPVEPKPLKTDNSLGVGPPAWMVGAEKGLMAILWKDHDQHCISCANAQPTTVVDTIDSQAAPCTQITKTATPCTQTTKPNKKQQMRQTT